MDIDMNGHEGRSKYASAVLGRTGDDSFGKSLGASGRIP